MTAKYGIELYMALFWVSWEPRDDSIPDVAPGEIPGNGWITVYQKDVWRLDIDHDGGIAEQ